MSPLQPAQIASIYRYPVKGLSPEMLPRSTPIRKQPRATSKYRRR
jgi:hypothetical protein